MGKESLYAVGCLDEKHELLFSPLVIVATNAEEAIEKAKPAVLAASKANKPDDEIEYEKIRYLQSGKVSLTNLGDFKWKRFENSGIGYPIIEFTTEEQTQ